SDNGVGVQRRAAQSEACARHVQVHTAEGRRRRRAVVSGIQGGRTPGKAWAAIAGRNMTDLFTSNADAGPLTPLAERLRPKTIDEVIGQRHLLAPGKPLAVAFAAGK